MNLYSPPTLFTGVPTFGSYFPSFVRAVGSATRRSFVVLADMMRANRLAALLFAGGVFFVFSFSAFLFSLPSNSVSAEGPAVPALATTVSGVRPLEIHIADNGLVLMRSARVVAVSGTTILVSTTWGLADFRWVVRTNATSYETHNFGTRFLSRDGTKLSYMDIHEGDLVTITGALDSTASEPTLNADSVRSLQ